MERSASEGVDVLASRANGRFTSSRTGSTPSRRSSLWSLSRSKSKDDHGASGRGDAAESRPASSGSSDSKHASSAITRIPRPTQQQRPSQTRTPYTLTDAYKQVEAEEAAQNTPSPAPRTWRTRSSSSTRNKLHKPPPTTFSRQVSGSGRGEPFMPASSPGALSIQSDVSDSDIDEKLRQHAMAQAEAERPAPRANSILSRSKFRSLAEMGKGLARKTSRSSLDSRSNWLSRRLSGVRHDASSGISTHESPSWEQIGDSALLQASTVTPAEPVTRPATVPPKHGAHWTKNSEKNAEEDVAVDDSQTFDGPFPNLMRSNPKIDEIRLLEMEAASMFPDEETGSGTRSNQLTRGRELSRTNAKIEELRAQESRSLLRKIPIVSKLDGISEYDPEHPSRPRSSEIGRKPSKDSSRTSASSERLRMSDAFSKLPVRRSMSSGRSQPRDGDVRVAPEEAPTPAFDIGAPAVAPQGQNDVDNNVVESTRDKDNQERAGPARRNSHGERHSEERDRQLQVSGDNPPTGAAPLKGEYQSGNQGRALKGAFRNKSLDSAKGDVRPSVGFTGLRRDPSVDSALGSRSNPAQSESDPTERIYGEMSLFAPMENQSERGSQRALSPDLDEDEEYETPGETPKPNRGETARQSLPTARVSTGPTTTIKTEDIGEPSRFATVKPMDDHLGSESTQGPDGATHSRASSRARGRKRSMSPRKIKHTLSARGDRTRDRASLVRPHRRSKSLSQLRLPLANSANPPTVRDDLFEIHRTNHIEDSTLDDLADLLESKDNVRGPAHSANVVPKAGSRNKTMDGENEIEVYKRMSESLKTGLLGIRTAKQGIERLETSVFNADAKDPGHQHNGDANSVCSACQDDSSVGHTKVTYVHLPLPQLYQRQPRFKFTLLGLMLLLVTLWYIGESTMCSKYCKPQYCYPGKPCNWSPDDPVWGYSIPVKLDQWVTGGRGKVFANQATLDITDWIADMWDAANGIDITKVDTSNYTWEQKRQHRRRLMNKGLVRPSRERKRGKARRVS
ncbi:hypothetical protein QBC32DRAFT_136545 [Pseudoneurospora amorphoporcata]|uniref:Uncharacterized protein n=1 Tax=Pseudoneurospora amorphoporcata TaxID=241081 RepID=A0AAN6SJ85_9PEZI|nr:hypothetical protein QBC32DRAFT_136545 [Pseudoneurospora amorphoporcata]